MLQNMLCLYSFKITIQLQISQSCFLSMLNVILTFQETLWQIEILALFLIFDEKSARFKWLSNISLLLIIFKQMIKEKLWIRLLRTIWKHILQKIKQCEQSCFLLHNLFIITDVIILFKWVWINYYMNSIVRFTLTLQTTSSREKYQLQKITLKSFTNYSRSCIYN